MDKVVFLLALLLTTCACYTIQGYNTLIDYPKCPCAKIFLPVCASDGSKLNNILSCSGYFNYSGYTVLRSNFGLA
ncbi:unnamed protein product [Leptosia nina]|uniref:Kazal-like domain-containing protein n=1 Tax=Leptosia nina TaxID=320188 RepID=A0AAV1K1A2_9NEOP